MADVIFEFAEKSKKLDNIIKNAFSIMNGNETYKSIIERINNDLKVKENESKLCITFVGQYSSGKSTIISALTGNDKIKIDSNISTDSTTKYPWRDVILVDTPGLYTHHPEHDNITEDAIKQADILVYCLTYSLFDLLLLKDFQKLAYERGYAGKMFLIINKMDGEYGKHSELVKNYKKTLIKDLGEDNLKKFPLCFITAQWQRDSDPDVRKESHFDDFITQLNNFINKNGQMNKLLGSANIFIDNIQQGIIENNDSENKIYFQIIDRVEKQFKKQERECDSFFISLMDELRSKIINAGFRLLNMEPKNKTEAEENCRKIESELELYCNSAVKELEEKFSSVQEELNSALEEIAGSELVQNFYLSEQVHINDLNYGEVSKKGSVFNAEHLNSFLNSVSDGTLKIASYATGKAGAGFLLKASGASGSVIHTSVKTVGHFFGVSFKPWQAVNIAKNIGNFAKILGPLAIAATVIVEIVDAVKEKKHEQKELAQRRDLLASFSEQADSVVLQFKNQYKEYIKQTILNKMKMIKDTRDQRTRQINLTNQTAKELKTCIEEFKKIISAQ